MRKINKYGIINYLFLSAIIFLSPLKLCSETEKQIIYVGSEPFVSVSIVNKILKKILITANEFGLRESEIIETHSFENFIKLSEKQSYSLFYGAPPYANYLMHKYNYIPLLALEANDSAVIIKSTTSNVDFQDTTKNMTVYSLPDYDVFTLAAKSHLKEHANITYNYELFVDRIIINVLKKPDSLGIVASSDLRLLIPKLRNKISIIATTSPIKYGYIMMHPRHKKNMLNLKNILFKTHEFLSQERNNYFYKTPPEYITDKHIVDINKYSNVFDVFENSK